MAYASRAGQLSYHRNRASEIIHQRFSEFQAYLADNPIFVAELITEPPAGALLMPMGYRCEGLYRHPIGQGVVNLDAWQMQPRTMQRSAYKAPPRKRRGHHHQHLSLIVEHHKKEAA